MAKVFDLSVDGFICCNLRPAHVGDVFLLTLSAAKFGQGLDPVEATVTKVVETIVEDADDPTKTASGTVYTVSVEDEDMPAGLDILTEDDISGFDCPGCCFILEQTQLRDGILKWSPGEEVEGLDLRIAQSVIWESLGGRTTGAVFDDTEKAFWKAILSTSTTDLSAEIAARIAGDANLQEQIDALEGAPGGAVSQVGIHTVADAAQVGTVVFPNAMPDDTYALIASLSIPVGGSRISLFTTTKTTTGFSFEMGDQAPGPGYEIHYQAAVTSIAL